MRIGIPAEVKNHEYRVAITPAGVRELVLNGHEIFVQAGAGTGSSITDAEYQAAGAQVLRTADDVWGTGDLILKVKEPIAEEYGRMRAGQVLFTYLHLAADKRLTEELVARKVTGIAYETVQTPDGALAPARPDVRGGRPARAAGRRRHLDEGRGRPRCPDGRRPGGARRQGRGDRRRCLRAERRRHRSRYAGRGPSCSTSTSTGSAPSTRSTAARYKPSPATPSRSSARCSAPTWSSGPC